MESKDLEQSAERLRNLLRRKVPDLLLQAECGGGLELPDPLPWGFASVPTLYELADAAERDLQHLELERERQRQGQLRRTQYDSGSENEERHLSAPAQKSTGSGNEGIRTVPSEETCQNPQLQDNPITARPGPNDEDAGVSGAGPSTALSPHSSMVQSRDGGGERPEASPLPPLPPSPPPPLPEEESGGTVGARAPSPAPPEPVYACTAFLDSLQCSRSFRSPHCEGAMAEALGLTDLYDGLAGSTLGPPPRREELEAFRQLLKQHINARWALEAVKQGVAAAKQGNYTDAHKCYDRALELDPSSAEAYVARGAAHANQRNFSEAEQDLRRALELDPSHRNAGSYLAAVLQHAAKRDLEQQQQQQRQQQQSRAAEGGRHRGVGQQQHQEVERGSQRQRGREGYGQMGTRRPDDDRPGAPYQGCAENAGYPSSGGQQELEGAGVDGRRRRGSSSASSSSGELSMSSGGSGDNTPGARRAGALERPASDDIKRALEVVMKARKEKRRSKHKRHKKKHKKSKRRKGG